MMENIKLPDRLPKPKHGLYVSYDFRVCRICRDHIDPEAAYKHCIDFDTGNGFTCVCNRCIAQGFWSVDDLPEELKQAEMLVRCEMCGKLFDSVNGYSWGNYQGEYICKACAEDIAYTEMVKQLSYFGSMVKF